MGNIILIGLPSCGKTSLGKRISEEEGLNFIDLDDYVVERNNMTIEEMFNISEKFFRDKETEAIMSVCKCKNTVIATGGGVIKREENMKILRKCGCVIFIHRSPQNIINTVDISTRPLLREGKETIYVLYKERHELYKKYSHIIVDNNDTEDKVIKMLSKIIKDNK